MPAPCRSLPSYTFQLLLLFTLAAAPLAAQEDATTQLRAYADLVETAADRSDYPAVDSLVRLADPLLERPAATPEARYHYRRARAAARSLDGRHREALADLLALTHEDYRPPPAERLQTHKEIALTYNRLFVPDSAMQFIELAHDDARQVLDTAGLPYAYFQNDLTVVYIRAERFGEAEAAARRGLRLLEAHGEGGSDYAANALDNLANVLDNLARYEEALTYRQRSLELYETLGLRDKHARSLYNLAIGRYGLGDFGAAAQYVDRSLRIRIDLLGADHPSLTSAYHAQSVLQSLAGNHEAAVAAFRNLVSRTERNQGSGGETLARFYEGLGLAYKGMERLDSAVLYQKKAIDLLVANRQTKGPAMARTRYNYSGTLSALGRSTEALRQIELARATFERLGLDTTLEFSQMVAAHADRLAQNGQIAAAREASKQAQELIRTPGGYRLGPDPTSTLDLLCQAAFTIYRAKPTPAHLRRFEGLEADLLEVAETTRRQFHDPQAKSLLNRRLSDVLARHLDYYAELYDNLREPHFLERIYTLSESARAALIRDRIATGSISSPGLPDSIPARMADYQRRIESLYYATENGGPAADDLRDSLFQTRRSYDTFLAGIKTDHPEYYQLNVTSGIRARTQVQTLLQDQKKDAIVYLRGVKNYYALVGSEKWALIDLGNVGRIDSAVQTYREAIASVLTDEHLAAGYDLYRLLWEPVAPHLQQPDVLIVPAGPLAQLPFEALSRRTDRADYLINDHTIGYAYALTLYYRQEGLSTFFEGAAPVIVVPGFAKNATDSSGHLEPQPWSLDLANTLATNYNMHSLIGEAADEENVLRAMASTNLLLFASHGRMDPAAPLRSGIELSPTPGSPGDHRLTLAEVFSSRIPADLAILGLCESGLGESAPGDGMLSLAYAFTYAGCGSTINTLWMVDEVANSTVIERTLAELAAGQDRAAALRQAKLSFLEAFDASGLGHPYYWSGLVLQGRDGAVKISGRRTNEAWWLLGFVAVTLFLVVIFKKR
jgi:CHAT domain-containing protein